MAIRLYHLAAELNVRSSELLALLDQRGVKINSVMTVLDDAATDRARRVAKGQAIDAEPAAGRGTLAGEIRLPPPVVPAPARPLRPAIPTHPAAKRAPMRAPQQQQRRGIKIFKQKEARERKSTDRAKAEEILSGRTIPIVVPISLKDFSQEIGVKANVLLLHLMKQGIMANPNTTLDDETVLVMAEAFNRTVEIKTEKNVEEELEELVQTDETDGTAEGVRRPPVVAVLGHVDHGKTSLLDKIRSTRVAAGEAGGITQHIGAYSVTLDDGQQITFLDTPGHEAFTAMRARGAKLTDIVILIVAADDGVMPQTEEALSHARAAEVPIIVAINKCDRAEARPDKPRQQLAALNLAPEEWGGETAMIDISAQTGDGIPELLERITLEAELIDLSANPAKPADGYVVEARKQTGKGVVATLLIKDGTLRRGEMTLAGACQGRIKSMTDHKGKQVSEAPPSMAVEVTGLDDIPEAGQRFQVVRDKELARKVASQRSVKKREKSLAAKAGGFETLMSRIGTQKVKEMRIVLKADVKGSIEALRTKLEQLSGEDVKLKILHTGVGGISESDILLAEASGATVIGFHVLADAKARTTADRAEVKIRLYQIIYELLDDVKSVLQGLMPKDIEEIVIGHAEIRQIFIYRKTKIGGCMVIDGVARRKARVRLTRDGRVIMNAGSLESLRRFKDDAKEVKEGYDCGLRIEDYDDIKEGDIIEFYELEEKQRTL